MSILVLRHESFEHLGYFDPILRQCDISFKYKDLGEDLPSGDFSALLVMGGPQSANDPDPALIMELSLIQQYISAGKPILGICLGAQLLAKALGARVFRNPVKEIGWFPISFTAAASADPMWAGFSSPSVFFQWHAETFDLPEGATWLAFSKDCRNQVFRYGSNVYGVQFHPEITPGMIADWSAQPANCGDVQVLDNVPDPGAFDTSELARLVLVKWLQVACLIEDSACIPGATAHN